MKNFVEFMHKYLGVELKWWQKLRLQVFAKFRRHFGKKSSGLKTNQSFHHNYKNKGENYE